MLFQKIQKTAFIGLTVLFAGLNASAGMSFISPSAISASQFQAPPPAQSAAAAADLQQVLAYQQVRTQAECNRAAHESPLTLSAIFGAPYGPLTSSEILAGQALYEALKADSDYFVSSIKNIWNRPRPYQESRDVKICVPPQPTSSYPSGHATISRVAALTFSMMYPDKAQALMASADQVAIDRVIGGVHHPLDVQAGQHLADLIFAKMQSNPNFARAMDHAKSTH